MSIEEFLDNKYIIKENELNTAQKFQQLDAVSSQTIEQWYDCLVYVAWNAFEANMLRPNSMVNTPVLVRADQEMRIYIQARKELANKYLLRKL